MVRALPRAWDRVALLLTRARGHGGEYWYFVCTARQDRACGSPYVRIEDAEAAVLQHYMTLRLPGGFAARVCEVLKATLGGEQQSTRLMHEHLTKTLRDLEAKEENLLDLVETGPRWPPRCAPGSSPSGRNEFASRPS